MKQQPPTLAPLLRSDLQGDLLALLWLTRQEYSLSDLSRRLDVAVSTIHTEVERLFDADLVTDRRVGRTRLVKANEDHPLTPPLRELLELTYGPIAMLPPILDALEDVEEAYIYGSWAERRLGRSGAHPRDLDVLLIGSPSRRAAARAQTAASQALGHEVNITVLSRKEWESPTTGFARTVRDGALVPVALG